MEYSYSSIYGFYEKQDDLINGRTWYKNDGRSIWWDGIDDWKLGKTIVKGSMKGYAYLENNGTCPTNISNPKWKINIGPDQPWLDAGDSFKIRCQFRPTGIEI